MGLQLQSDRFYNSIPIYFENSIRQVKKVKRVKCPISGFFTLFTFFTFCQRNTPAGHASIRFIPSLDDSLLLQLRLGKVCGFSAYAGIGQCLVQVSNPHLLPI